MDLVKKACNLLIENLGDKIVAVSLFGSLARGEASKYSDVDFFIVVRNFNDPNRRFKIYHYLYSVLKKDVTVIDIDENKLFRDDLKISPLLLNIIYDSIILYDPTGRLTKLFDRIKYAIDKNLVRYKTPDGKYGWKPRKGILSIIKV